MTIFVQLFNRQCSALPLSIHCSYQNKICIWCGGVFRHFKDAEIFPMGTCALCLMIKLHDSHIPLLTPEKVSICIITLRKLIVLFYKIQGKKHTLMSETAQFHPMTVTYNRNSKLCASHAGTTVSLCFYKISCPCMGI